jgi:hypothetical protein
MVLRCFQWVAGDFSGSGDLNRNASGWHTLRRVQGENRHNSLRSAFGTYSVFSLSPAPLSAGGVYQFPEGNWISEEWNLRAVADLV